MVGPMRRAFEGLTPKARHRTHSIAVERQVVQAYLAGETLHGLLYGARPDRVVRSRRRGREQEPVGETMAEERGDAQAVGVDGKVVLVTGASRGIGACCVRAMLDGGASVVIHYNARRDAAEALAEAAPERCHLVAADLAEDAAPRALWQQALDWQGRIDVLVNNAGVYQAEPEGADATDDAAWRGAWQRTLQINLIAPAALARLAVDHFRGCGGGILIHLSSRAAHRGEKPLLGAYAASKAALNALSHTIARNDGAAGVLSYAVAPGWVGTDMSWDYIDETGDRGPLAENALGTLIPPEEVANIVAFLASGAARHATGTVIDINGASFPR